MTISRKGLGRMTSDSRTNSDSGTDSDLEAFRSFLDTVSGRVDATLSRRLKSVRVRPRIINDAMRYTALAEGKRLRPGLVILAYEACGGRGRKADPVAAAVEMVHAFSLIHDDLPAMDDDDMRRGKPSNHRVFGEGIAILAGDALLALAFQTLSSLRHASALGPEITVRLVEELSDATGATGVIGGQVLDLLCEGAEVPRATVTYIHRHKTARLFAAALRLGGLAAGTGPARLRSLTRYGETAGTAFQIVDDILNAAGSFTELGRNPGRDQARGKVTYPRIVGMAASHRAVSRLLGEARRETSRFPEERRRFDGLLDLLDGRRRNSRGRPLGEKE
jgi:geranylgeranyl diphosphate synthase type II